MPKSRTRKKAKPIRRPSYGWIGMDSRVPNPVDVPPGDPTADDASVPAESYLVALHMHFLQAAMHGAGLPRGSCIPAVLALRTALAKVGIPSEPVTVLASVDLRDGLPAVQVGSMEPSWNEDGSWGGHLGLWLPTLRRFADPAIYQAGRGRSYPIGEGVLLRIPAADLASLPGRWGCEKQGCLIEYRLVEGESWRARRVRGQQAFARKAASTVHAYVREYMQSPGLRASMGTFTDAGVLGAGL